MRLLLTFLLFAMTYRCFGVLLPMKEWQKEYAVEGSPRPLPSPSERIDPVAAAGRTAEDLGHFWTPWPKSDLHSPVDGAKWAACWLNSRLRLLERVVAIEEQWTMFAPSVDTAKIHTRARLFYSDGSDVVIHARAEPEDYTQGGHWWEDRVTSYEYRLDDNWAASWGWCNLLAHRHPHNAAGARLVKIVLFAVKVELPAPGVDAMKHYRQQNLLNASPPAVAGKFRSDMRRASSQVIGDRFVFDPDTKEGRLLK